MKIQTNDDTIAAICTGPGGALAILRLSGPEAADVAAKLWFGNGPALTETPRKMRLGHALAPDGESCLAVYMPAPHSYTGDNVAEIQCHGGDFAPDRLLREALKNGARMAEPGEFTRRAFLNGRMDLTQAEAVLELIQARTEAAAALAERQLSGHLGGRIREARAPLTDVLAEIESRLDFPEEELDWQTPGELAAALEKPREILRALLSGGHAGAILRNGVRLVIAGAPNVGKSSLMNLILGYDRAIVTAIPGTTRDTLEETAEIRGILFRLTDTAGLRDDASDPVENAGIERSKDSLRNAEIVLWLMDAARAIGPQRGELERTLPGVPALLCLNKIDLLPAGTPIPALPGEKMTAISARTGDGLENLFDALAETVGLSAGERETDCAVSGRHETLLRQALEALDGVGPELEQEAWELAASRLRTALFALGTVTGETAEPDVLDQIFSRFCIGK